jgi:L-2-hydroxyglutarate oxidase LhgO
VSAGAVAAGSGPGYDVVIVGAGIVGLATGLQLLRRRPALRLAILERESRIASHQSSHNSGVVHAGLYYAPGSLKARLCREGKSALERYCEERAIPLQRVGKLVVATQPEELARLDALRSRAEANGVEGLEAVGPERIREIEPAAVGLAGLWSPGTGIVEYRRVAEAYAADIEAAGGRILTSHRLAGVRRDGRDRVLETTSGAIRSRKVVACAGLWADDVAAMTGGAGPERIVPFRGDYYTLRTEARSLVRGLIYPVPDPRFPFLGIHLTRRIDGEVIAGPNAVLAFARTGYRRRDLNVADLARAVAFRGFLRLAARYWRTGLAELWRDVSRGAFLATLQRYVPALRGEHLVFGPSGVRAQALDPDGRLVDDFRLGGDDAVLHVRNAPSPAATASLAIGRELAETAIGRFEL